MEVGNRESGIGKSRARIGWQFIVSFMLPALPIPDFRLSIPGSVRSQP